MIRWNGPVIATVDFLMSFAVAAVALMAPPAVPKPEDSDKATCRMAIDLKWDSTQDVDIDLWVAGPDGKPVGWQVGYSHGVFMDLVRDDRGMIHAADRTNEERTCVRILGDGEYVVNLHFYGDREAGKPAAMDVAINLIDPVTAFMSEVYKRDITLDKKGDEKTVVRFKLKDGKILPESINIFPKKVIPTSVVSPTNTSIHEGGRGNQ